MRTHRLLLVGLAAAAAVGCGKVSNDVDANVTPQHTVTISSTGNGSGVVTSMPAGIDCGATCSASFDEGTSIVLHAAPAAGSTFVGWTGGGCTGTGDCTVAVNADVTVMAAFAQNNSIVVMLAGNGQGTVTSSPAGIDCPGDCEEAYGSGTTVTLTATPTGDSYFEGWSGGGCSGTGTCTVTTNSAIGVTATFTLNRYTLTAARSGNGSGTITSDVGGIDCGATCSDQYDSGTAVTLTATPATGTTFAGWSGGGCSGTGTCVVNVTTDLTVTASFVLQQHTLAVTKSGNGGGTVTSSPGGINCGSTCGALFNYGTMVTLTASPANGSQFSGWSGGGCAGTGTCTVTVVAAATVNAQFTLRQYTLTVAKAGSGAGTVTSVPAGINCGASCSAIYNYGTSVTLTAVATTGQFTGWSGGGCTGTGTCTTTITAAVTVTATFSSCTSGSQTFNYTGGVQTASIPSCVTSITIDARGGAGGIARKTDGTLIGTSTPGGRVVATVPIAAGDVIRVYVGGKGGDATGASTPGVGGFNGGAGGGNYTSGQAGGGGGGASDVRRNGTSLATRIVVAGGAGGTSSCSDGPISGGVGGGLTGGGPTVQCTPGTDTLATGGTQSAGGSAGVYPGYCSATNGSLGSGGAGCSPAGSGGGGGGYYGGGGGAWHGGAGGSSFTAAGATGVTHTQGYQAGNGQVIISW